MGAILDLVSMIFTPVGLIATAAAGAALFFFARWVLTD
jgi:hypothetical protein